MGLKLEAMINQKYYLLTLISFGVHTMEEAEWILAMELPQIAQGMYIL